MVIPMKQYEQEHCFVDLVFGWDCRARSDSAHFGLREKVLTDVPVTPEGFSISLRIVWTDDLLA